MGYLHRLLGLPKASASVWLLSLLPLVLADCKGETASAPPPPLPHVEVVEVIQKDVPIYSEWVGTLDGSVNALIRAQVSGYLMRRPYTEGGYVKKAICCLNWTPASSRRHWIRLRAI